MTFVMLTGHIGPAKHCSFDGGELATDRVAHSVEAEGLQTGEKQK